MGIGDEVFQLVLALCQQACQPSYLAQEFPNRSIPMRLKTKLAAISSMLPALLAVCTIPFLPGCGGSPESTSTKSTSVQTTTAAPAPIQPQANPSEKMAIPFEIAIQAALEGHSDTVKQALETGTQPNQVDENGRTMLMVAAFNGHTTIANYLIEQGAQLDTQDVAGRTALMFASTGPNVPTVQLLLDHKAKVNLVDSEEHWTALMFAAAEGHREVVDLLLKYEADLSLKDIDGSTAESFARDNGHIELADYLKSLAENP